MDPLVYTTDASWKNRGNRSGTRYHSPHPDDPGVAACRWSMLDDDSCVRASDVPELLCRTAACRKQRLLANQPQEKP